MSQNVNDVRVDGIEITLGKQKYILPPLPLIKLKNVKKLMTGGSPDDDEYLESMISALHDSLKRNYPDIQRESIAEDLDMKNYKTILNAFMEANGFAKVEAQPAGELIASQ